MSPQQDEYREEDEPEDYASRSIFAAGWFRAVLVLTVLAIVVVVSLPYLLDWFEPSGPPQAPKSQSRPAGPSTSRTAPSVETPSTLVPAPPPAPKAQTPAATAIPAAPSAAPAKPPPDKPAVVAAPRPAGPAPATAPKLTPEAGSSKPTAAVRRPGASASPAPAAAVARGESAANHWVQVGIFKDPRNAENLAKTLRGEGFPVQVARVTREAGSRDPGGLAAGTYHLVRAGGFPDRGRAVSARDELKAKGHLGFLTQGPAK